VGPLLRCLQACGDRLTQIRLPIALQLFVPTLQVLTSGDAKLLYWIELHNFSLTFPAGVCPGCFVR